VLHTPNETPKTTFKATHVRGSVRQLTCDEADCNAKAMGWRTVLPIPAHQDAANFIRAGKTSRRFKEVIESEGLVTFYFAEGQNCFEKHWQRDPVFNIKRRNTGGGIILYPDGDAFVEDSDKHLRKLKEAING
jgi:hypothetical protein